MQHTLKKALIEAGHVLMRHYGKIQSFDRKSDIDLVTAADREAEEVIKSVILADYPHHEILAEESGLLSGRTAEVRWLVDPVDGTTNYAHGFPIFAVSIAVEQQGEITNAGVFNPLLNEMFLAEKGRGSTLNGISIQVSTIETLRDALMVSGFPYDRRERVHHYLKAWELMIGQAQGMLRTGSAAVDLCYVAAGRTDGYWEESLSPWDTAAGLLILREAGGTVTDFSGNPFTPYLKEVLGTNTRLHEQTLAVLDARRQAMETR